MRTGRQDVPLGHGADRVLVLLEHGIGGAAALAHVAFKPARQADRVGRIDENFQIEQPPDRVPVKREEAFDDEEGARLELLRCGSAHMPAEVVRRDKCGPACGECRQIARNLVGSQRVGHVEVPARAVFGAQLGEIAVVTVQ